MSSKCTQWPKTQNFLPWSNPFQASKAPISKLCSSCFDLNSYQRQYRVHLLFSLSLVMPLSVDVFNISEAILLAPLEATPSWYTWLCMWPLDLSLQCEYDYNSQLQDCRHLRVWSHKCHQSDFHQMIKSPWFVVDYQGVRLIRMTNIIVIMSSRISTKHTCKSNADCKHSSNIMLPLEPSVVMFQPQVIWQGHG